MSNLENDVTNSIQKNNSEQKSIEEHKKHKIEMMNKIERQIDEFQQNLSRKEYKEKVFSGVISNDYDSSQKQVTKARKSNKFTTLDPQGKSSIESRPSIRALYLQKGHQFSTLQSHECKSNAQGKTINMSAFLKDLKIHQQLTSQHQGVPRIKDDWLQVDKVIGNQLQNELDHDQENQQFTSLKNQDEIKDVNLSSDKDRIKVFEKYRQELNEQGQCLQRVDSMASRIFTPLETDHHESRPQTPHNDEVLTEEQKQFNALVEKMRKLKAHIQAERQRLEESLVQDERKLTRKEIGLDYEDEFMPVVHKLKSQMESQIQRPNDLFRRASLQNSIKQNVQRADKSKQHLIQIQKFVDQVYKQLEYFGLAKHQSDALFDEYTDKDPVVGYINSCREQQLQIDASILPRIENKQLKSSNNTLSEQICLALYQALKNDNDMIRAITLEDNGLTDDKSAIILEGLSQQIHLGYLFVKRNEILQKSICYLQRMVLHPQPSNLKVLKIVSCKISQSILEDFLESIKKSSLRSLALVDMNLNIKSVKSVSQMIQQSSQLIEIDIGWNKFSAKSLQFLFEALKSNRYLELLNMSWNKLPQSKDKLTIQDQQNLVNLGQFIEHNKNLHRLDLSNTSMTKEYLEELIVSVKKAKSLLVLDVSQDEEYSIETKRQLRSLLDLDTDTNASDLQTKVSSEYLLQKILQTNKNNSKKQDQIIYESMHLQDIKESINNQQRHKIVPRGQNRGKLIFERALGHQLDIPNADEWKEISNETARDGRKDWVSSNGSYTLFFWSKNFSKSIEVKNQSDQNLLQQLDKLQRQPEMKKYRELNRERQKKIPPLPTCHKGVLSFKDLDEQAIEERADQNFRMPPILTGTVTDWEYIPMIKIEEFLQCLDSQAVDPFKYLKEIEVFSYDIKRKQDLKSEEIQQYVKQREHFIQNYSKKWLKILLSSCLQYQNPQLINVEHFENYPQVSVNEGSRLLSQALETTFKDVLLDKIKAKIQHSDETTQIRKQHNIISGANKMTKLLKDDSIDNDQLYVAAAICSPGKHSYMVKYLDCDLNCKNDKLNLKKYDKNSEQDNPSDSQEIGSSCDEEIGQVFNYSFHTCTILPRIDEIPKLIKVSEEQRKQMRHFEKESSVFHDWRIDGEHVLNQCFREDLKHWKASQFISKKKDLQDCERYLRMNYRSIKKIFVAQMCKSNYPCINWLKFQEICDSCDVFDSNVTVGDLDEAFIATNVELEEMPDNPSTDLQRFEFLEIIARIAHLKYFKTGQCSSNREAIETFLDNHLYRLEFDDEWQEFRDKRLWTLEVNDLFKANEKGLRKLYKLYAQRQPQEVVVCAVDQTDQNETSQKSLQNSSIEHAVSKASLEIGSQGSCPSPEPKTATISRKVVMSLQDALDFLIKESGLNIQLRDAVYLFGMSKMTVINENAISYDSDNIIYNSWMGPDQAGGNRQYFEMHYVEFLEMLGRVAEHKYSQKDHTKIPGEKKLNLVNQIEILLDVILPMVGMTRLNSSS